MRVNALAPAWFKSEMTADMFADERSMDWLRRKTPMGRVPTADELDGPLLFASRRGRTVEIVCPYCESSAIWELEDELPERP